MIILSLNLIGGLVDSYITERVVIRIILPSGDMNMLEILPGHCNLVCCGYVMLVQAPQKTFFCRDAMAIISSNATSVISPTIIADSDAQLLTKKVRHYLINDDSEILFKEIISDMISS